jgi:hypothetical protein
MHMIRHHDSDPEIEFAPLVMETTFQDDPAHPLWKNPPMIGTKCYEVSLVIALKMRKPSPIKCPWHS